MHKFEQDALLECPALSSHPSSHFLPTPSLLPLSFPPFPTPLLPIHFLSSPLSYITFTPSPLLPIQLLEYQRRCGVFNKPLPPSTYKTTAAVGKARASADGIVKATLAPSVRVCPFCKREFGQFECSERQFMDHVNNCRD